MFVMSKTSSILICLVFCMVSSVSTFAQIDRALIAQLDTILQDDQKYRTLKVESPELDRMNMARQAVLDLGNLEKVERILKRYGYPGKSRVGEKHQSTVFLVIQHSTLEVQERYYSTIKAAVVSKQLSPGTLALLEDRINVARGKPQIYGTQLRETISGSKILPILDEKNVDERRKKLGLPGLSSYYSKWGIKYKVPTAQFQNPDSLYFVPDLAVVEAIGGDLKIYERLKYPESAAKADIKGKVTVEFVVDKDGFTKDIIVVKSLGFGCDEEAIRVIKSTLYLNETGEDRELRMTLPFPYIKP